MVLCGKHSPEEISQWLARFQCSMNRHAGSDSLQFTASVWKEGKNAAEASGDKVSTIHENTFPFLDMDLFWDMGVLAFCMHKKVNQQLN